MAERQAPCGATGLGLELWWKPGGANGEARQHSVEALATWAARAGVVVVLSDVGSSESRVRVWLADLDEGVRIDARQRPGLEVRWSWDGRRARGPRASTADVWADPEAVVAEPPGVEALRSAGGRRVLGSR